MPGKSPAVGQKGVALLLILFIMVIGATTIFLTAWNNGQGKQKRDQKTELALQQAKEALIAWAANRASPNDPNGFPGQLPCPEDTSQIGNPLTEGQAQSSCTSPTSPVIGRLAWKSLQLGDLTDGDGERLWYVLSPGFRTTPVNSDTPGKLDLDGQPEKAIALIIAPGPPLAGQNRSSPTPTMPPNIKDYLDGTNNDGDLSFTAIPVASALNDRVLAIYPADLFPAVEKRVANEVRFALLEYFCGVGQATATGACIGPPLNGYFPRPAAFADATCLGTSRLGASNCLSAAAGNEGRIPANPAAAWNGSSILRGNGPPTTWFQANGWREQVYYAVALACIDGTSNCNGGGYLTVQRPGSPSLANVRVVVAVAGRYLGSSARSKNIVADYLEDENATTGDNTFTFWPANAGTPFNDRLAILP